jgi:uncharacterized membrane protein
VDWDYLNDWAAFLVRWLHVIAAIVWIGTSFYFVALDKHLRPSKREPDGVAGEAWEIHGGGFYRVEKYRVAPERLPEPLYWFKWEAYTTWLSGFGLLVLLYYIHPDVYLVDRSVADLSGLEAALISVGLLAAAVAVYEVLCRLLKNRDLWLAAALLVLVAAATYGVSNLFSGRGTYLQLGAMLGTIMAANVLFVIIPGHWELVRAKQAGREQDPAPGLEGKRRSVHNNYLTLPVLLAMISIHFPTAYAHEHGWAVLVALMIIGAWVRHFFNLRHGGRTAWWIPATAAAAVVALAVAIEPDETAAPAAQGRVAFSQVRGIIASRCAECHSAHPTNTAFTSPPAGVVFDTPAQIAARAKAIDQQAVRSRAMPLGNVTAMTEEERSVLAAWIDAGAPTR